MVLCLFLRFQANLAFPDRISYNFTMTHLRIDSLLVGVFISYLYYFKFNYLKQQFESYKHVLLFIAFLGLSWTPFVDTSASFFAMTLGFSVLFISFGIFLTYFLLTTDINQRLNSIFSAPLVNFISKIGYCSYSIYIIHEFVNGSADRIYLKYHLYYNHYLNFLITTTLTLIIGTLITYTIESYFLKIRDKHYPSRVA